MRLLTVTLLLSCLSLPGAKADDKSKSILQKLNPLSRFRKDESPSKTKQNLDTLRNDPDEKKRKDAAVELRETDSKEVGDVIPVLVASLKQDPSVTVRANVAETLGKFKPVAAAGSVLEAAAINDPSDIVRTASQVALKQYQQNGYRLTAMTVSQTAEPPLAKPRPTMTPFPPSKQIMAGPTPPVPTPAPAVPAGVNRGPTFTETAEPPVAKLTQTPTVPTAPPVAAMPTPLPLPAAPKLPMPMPGKTPTPMPIPTPPPQNDPDF